MSLSPADKQALAQRIRELRESLLEALGQGESATEVVELDQTRLGRLSRMDALQAQAMAKAGAQRASAQLLALQGAEQRLQTEDYGLCQNCDEDISLARLHLNPAVTLCIACAQDAEKKPR